jgi:hypothetical protein
MGYRSDPLGLLNLRGVARAAISIHIIKSKCFKAYISILFSIVSILSSIYIQSIFHPGILPEKKVPETDFDQGSQGTDSLAENKSYNLWIT